MATKKTAAKKAAKKTTTKTKYYVAPVPQVVDVNSGDPLIEVVKTSEPADIKFMDASPAFVEVSKKEAVKVERSLEGRAFENIRQQIVSEMEDLRGGPSKKNAGDYLWAVLLFGSGFGLGAMIL